MSVEAMEGSMVFKRADQIFYRGVHKELFALVATHTLGEDLIGRYGDYTEVKVTVPPEDKVHTVPQMEVKVFGPEELEPVYRLPVLGVKLDLRAQRWLRATDIHPTRVVGGRTGIMARLPSRR